MRKSYLRVALMGVMATGIAMSSCSKDDDKGSENPNGPNGVPEKAVIIGDAANTCPDTSVTLTAAAMGATSYKWYNGTTAIDGATDSTYVVTASGTYFAAGVNVEGEGTKSVGKTVTISACTTPPAQATISGDAANTCPIATVTLTAAATDATSYQWYNGTTAIDGATDSTYVVTASGNYSVAGVNTVGTGTKSVGKTVTISACTVTWTLVDGLLTIEGFGPMKDYTTPTTRPWAAQIDSITSVDIGSGVTRIGKNAFIGCEALTSVTLGSGVTSIEESAFSDCIALTSVDIPNGVTSIGWSTFGGCEALTSVTIPNSVTSIEYGAFAGCIALTSVDIPNSVTSIGSSAFVGCYRLTSVDIPNGVTSIEIYTFAGCSALASVTIPNSITSIGQEAFYNCYSLTSVTIPNSVTSIGQEAFYGCSAFTSVTIPNSVTSIGESAFMGCFRLTSVTCLNPTPLFSGISSSITFHVPAGSVAAYEEAGWGNWGTVVEIVP
ncbi:hypothetical protein FACS1894199_00950 [Bacteroidia bacterium]|nr:hypothetical protein FACS1894199_00950 [Bacteroidia bacterium]